MDAIKNNPKLTVAVVIVVIAVVVTVVVLTQSNEYLEGKGEPQTVKAISSIKKGTKVKQGTVTGTGTVRSERVEGMFREANMAVTEVKNPSECLNLAQHYNVKGILYSKTKRGNLCIIYDDNLYSELKGGKRISKY